MKDGFNGKARSLSELVANIKDATYIDCVIRNKTSEFRFQIKRFPSEYLDFSQEGILSFLDGIFRKYTDMSDTNLVILLQPAEEATTTPLDFETIHQALKPKASQISFGEVSFLFNANMESITLRRVFPDSAQKSTPLRLRSEKYQELQRKWKDEMRRRQSNEGH